MSIELAIPYLPMYAETLPDHPHILDGDISAIFGGSQPALLPGEDWPFCGECEERLIPYIQINVSSPQTPSEFREKVGVRPKPGCSVVFQVFVCAIDECAECFQQCIVSGGGGTESAAWLVRVAQLDHGSLQAGTEAVENARAEMGEDKFFLPLRVISRWAAGRPEMLHEDAHIVEDEEVYEAHAPVWGLKLLGYPIQGKFYSCELEDQCPRCTADGGNQQSDWRCLLQLGTSTDEGAPLSVVGNTWISQCTLHPDVLAMTIGGNW